MKSKLIILLLLAAGSTFAETRFSFSIGTYAPGYYAPPPVYYAPAPAYGYRSNGYGYGGAGYWGENPERQHRRTEWRGLRNHHEKERYMYGDSWELREHQAEEREQLRREQRQEQYGNYEAGYGPAHGSARDGYHNH